MLVQLHGNSTDFSVEFENQKAPFFRMGLFCCIFLWIKTIDRIKLNLKIKSAL